MFLACLSNTLRRVAKVSGNASVFILYSLAGPTPARDSTREKHTRKHEKHEIHAKSSKYAEALEAGTVPCSVLPFEIREGGVPEDRDAFWALAKNVANRLQSGEAVLIHCAGGVGRTAMFAVSVLLALGEPMNEAESVVSRAGSIVETMPQIEMLSWCASRNEQFKDSISSK